MSLRNRRSVPLIVWLVVAALSLAAKSPFAGTWEGSVNGLPAIELTVQQRAGQVSGSIGFYFQSRGADGKWKLGDEFKVPLLSPRVEGNVLTFETIHHKTHGSPELGPNNKYRVELSGRDRVRLYVFREHPNESDRELELTRRR